MTNIRANLWKLYAYKFSGEFWLIAPVLIPYRLLPPTTPEVLAAVTWPDALSLYGDSTSLRYENSALLARAAHVF